MCARGLRVCQNKTGHSGAPLRHGRLAAAGVGKATSCQHGLVVGQE